MPTGTTKAEYRALMLRSEGLNQKYGLGQYSQQAIDNKLGEIGAWAVSSPQQKDTAPLVSEKLAGLDLQPATTSTSGGGFDWNDAGIGAALAFGFVILGVGSLLTVRQQHKPVPH
jgi:hypothetical protein